MSQHCGGLADSVAEALKQGQVDEATRLLIDLNEICKSKKRDEARLRLVKALFRHLEVAINQGNREHILCLRAELHKHMPAERADYKVARNIAEAVVTAYQSGARRQARALRRRAIKFLDGSAVTSAFQDVGVDWAATITLLQESLHQPDPVSV